MISKDAVYISNNKQVTLYNGDFLDVYSNWESPTVIVSDGPYGIGGFPGDPLTPDNLGKTYEPFIKAWSKASSPVTSLWFWNTEVGWANVHPYLVQNGWDYVSCNIWNKGLAHVAGNANTKTLRRLPVVTEICAHYVRRAEFVVDGEKSSMKQWLRSEWKRTGMPLSLTNDACGVKNAASRKYFTQCDLWYFPPTEAFEKLVNYANENGKKDGCPYFSLNGINSLTSKEWEVMRAKFHCPYGVTNVWDVPPLSGKERIKKGTKAFHLNQKPLKLMNLLIEIASDKNDVIWEPFGGLCSATVSAYKLNRKGFASELNGEVFNQAVDRIKSYVLQPTLDF